MKVLMFGWEFPPFNSGGLGTACYGLTKSLVKHAKVTFVMPRLPDENMKSHVKLVGANDLKNVNIKGLNIKQLSSPLVPYMTTEEYYEAINTIALCQGSSGEKINLYGKNLFEEVERLAINASLIAKHEDFDVIHAHDWLTFKAGVAAKKVSGKPLVVHVHATEFDRTGGSGVHQGVYDIERMGMHLADHIITVSNFTKQKVIQHYGVSSEKISVVHNGVIDTDYHESYKSKLSETDKIVLFLGRITIQKGPDYFIETAKKVSEKDSNVKFVIAGAGDMAPGLMQRAAELGIADKVLFTGFLRGDDIHKAYRMADLYVMPSVSEPFGITPLESLKNGTPVLISNQSGVSEVLSNCLKTDFWDVDEMTNKIVSVLKYNDLHWTLAENGKRDVSAINWDSSAEKCMVVYNQLKNNTMG